MDELDGFNLKDEDFAPAPRRNKMLINSSRYMKPPKAVELPERRLKFRFAEELAKSIELTKGCRFFVLLDGSFIAGDFIEALIVEKNMHVKNLTIATLSLSENNIDSLANLMNHGWVDELNLIVSNFFYSHERGNLIPYLYKELDKDDRFQLAVAGHHCKTALIETHAGHFLTMHGSANLRSSSSLEHIAIEEGRELYDFNLEYQTAIIEKYKTIRKPLRHVTLWDAVK